MSLQLPLRLDRIQQGLFEVLSDALNPTRVAWGYNQQAWETVPDEGLVLLTMVSGPRPFIRRGKRGSLLNAVDSIPLTIDAATPAARYVVNLNGFSYYTDHTGGDTVTTIRDRLLDAINADSLETATASAVGADGLTLTADSLGGLRHLTLSGPISAGAPVLNGASVLITEGAQEMMVNVQSFSKGREPLNGAWALSTRAMAALQSEDYVETLRRYGVGLWGKGTVSDISTVAGGEWETRTSFDLTIAARATWVRPVDRIESVKLTNNTEAPVSTQEFTITAP